MVISSTFVYEKNSLNKYLTLIRILSEVSKSENESHRRNVCKWIERTTKFNLFKGINLISVA